MKNHNRPLDPAMLAELLGGDLDSISHMLPEDYDTAAGRNDEDMMDSIVQQFIMSNPDLIESIIANPNMELPPLQGEDDERSGYWDAQTRGNKRGKSFMNSNGKVGLQADPTGDPGTYEALMSMMGMK